MSKNKKRCSKCKEEKSRSEFHKGKVSGNGLHAWCKPCKKKYSRENRKANSEKERERNREYRAANSEKERERSRKYRAANVEKERERSRKYRAANVEKERERCRKNRATNPEKVKEDARKQTSELSNYYVRVLVRKKYKVPNEYISDELIKDYRKLLILERRTNERRKEEQRKIIKGRVV